MFKIVKFNFLYLFIIAFCVIIQLYVSFQFRTMARGMEKTYEELEKFSLDNEKLKSEITDATSLSAIEKKAKKIGFVSANNFIYFSSLKLAQK